MAKTRGSDFMQRLTLLDSGRSSAGGGSRTRTFRFASDDDSTRALRTRAHKVGRRHDGGLRGVIGARWVAAGMACWQFRGWALIAAGPIHGGAAGWVRAGAVGGIVGALVAGHPEYEQP